MVPYDELEKRHKLKVPVKVRGIRGKLNVPRERFHLRGKMPVPLGRITVQVTRSAVI